jgi:hypothetical protein
MRIATRTDVIPKAKTKKGLAIFEIVQTTELVGVGGEIAHSMQSTHFAVALPSGDFFPELFGTESEAWIAAESQDQQLETRPVPRRRGP